MVVVAQPRQIPPGPEQGVLDHVLGKLAVPEDQAGGGVQARDGVAGQHGEGVMIAPPCPLDERPLVHGLPFVRARPTWSR